MKIRLVAPLCGCSNIVALTETRETMAPVSTQRGSQRAPLLTNRANLLSPRLVRNETRDRIQLQVRPCRGRGPATAERGQASRHQGSWRAGLGVEAVQSWVCLVVDIHRVAQLHDVRRLEQTLRRASAGQPAERTGRGQDFAFFCVELHDLIIFP